MSDAEHSLSSGNRLATLKLARSATGDTLTAHVPHDIGEEELMKVTKSAYGLIKKLTGCNCMSGRISYVVEDVYSDVIQVNL